MSNVENVEGYAGGVTPESYGRDPGHDVTHLAVPLAISGQTAEEATRNAQRMGELISHLADRVKFARWITTKTEATYALLANAHTALADLDDEARHYVVRASPVVAELRALLEIEPTAPVWVIETAAGLMMVPAAGRYADPGTRAPLTARRARMAELAAMGQDDEAAAHVDRDAVRQDVAGAEEEPSGTVHSDADPGL